MKLERIKHLTIENIIEFSPIMKLSITDAKPKITAFQKKHNIDYGSIKLVCRVIEALGL